MFYFENACLSARDIPIYSTFTVSASIAGCTFGLGALAASSTSALRILSLGPVPFTVAKSMPISAASFLAKGEANILPLTAYLTGFSGVTSSFLGFDSTGLVSCLAGC